MLTWIGKLKPCSLLSSSSSTRQIISANTKKYSHKYARICDINDQHIGTSIQIKGWIKSRRNMKNFTFLDINDGSGPVNLQVLLSKTMNSPAGLGYGASVNIIGVLNKTPSSGQLELKAESVTDLGECPLQDGFPFVPKQTHPPEYLRDRLHLRTRIAGTCAMLRVRHHATQLICKHLIDKGFWHINTPILTANDCEGAGEVFVVKPDNQKLLNEMLKPNIPIEQAYFDRKTYLTVSGQLHLEAIVHGMGDSFTFGPTFRAENSRTPIHLSEFYMLEIEKAFVKDLTSLTDCTEQLLKNVTTQLLDICLPDIELANKQFGKSDNISVDKKFKWLNQKFDHLSYADAVEIIQKNSSKLKKPFISKDIGGLTKEQELFLVEHIGKPIFITDWPSNMKPFYMRPKVVAGNTEDLVDAFDLLVPAVGELVGGSLREDCYDRLKSKLPDGSMNWYLELRKFGNVTTGGFGMGFERYLQFLMGVTNIKDVIPFPRWAHNCSM